MKATAVIGACFGDEGKGLVTDFLASRSGHDKNVLVVRFNGGAQAGHTVVLPENARRHVFHHFGSGTFAGAPTYLSTYFMVNPFVWRTEKGDLGRTPRTWAHEHCWVTTPWDMLINQALEDARHSRDSGRHGSCGLGVNETRVRIQEGPARFATCVEDLGKPILKDILLAIREDWLPQRLSRLAVELSPEAKHVAHSDALMRDFLKACSDFRSSVRMCTDDDPPGGFDEIIFEGAQGLLLDRDHEFFPHVTPSKTGLANVVQIARRFEVTELDVLYVMRPYLTRHGAGPFPTEWTHTIFKDDTNCPNDWQGTMRFGAFDAPLIAAAIKRDMASFEDATGLEFVTTFGIAMTHTDQFNAGKAITEIEALTGVKVRYVSDGPTRAHVKAQKVLQES